MVEFFTADGVAIPLDQLAQQTKLKGLIDLAIGKNSQSMYDGAAAWWAATPRTRR